MFQTETTPLLVEINGTRYIGFEDASISTSMLNICGTFSLTGTTLNQDKYPIKQGDKCVILLNNEPIITGFVNTVSPDLTVDSRTIKISGRDKTCDIDDSTLSEITLNSPINLVDVAKKVLKEIGISDIQIKCDIDLNPFKQNELMSCEIGEKAFSFLNKYARKRQVLLTTDGFGNIVFARASSKTFNTILCKNDTLQYKPNILESSASYDDSNRFHKYIIFAQINTSGAGEDEEYEEETPDKETYITATATDNAIRATRIYNYTSDVSYIDDADLKDRVNWMANNSKFESFKYTAKVQGFVAEQDNKIWRPNTLVHVIDDSASIDSTLLVTAIRYDYSMSGSFTILEMADSTCFSLEPVNPDKKKKGKDEGGEYLAF